MVTANIQAVSRSSLGHLTRQRPLVDPKKRETVTGVLVGRLAGMATGIIFIAKRKSRISEIASNERVIGASVSNSSSTLGKQESRSSVSVTFSI